LIDLLQDSIREAVADKSDSLAIQATANSTSSDVSEGPSLQGDGAGSENDPVVDDEITDE